MNTARTISMDDALRMVREKLEGRRRWEFPERPNRAAVLVPVIDDGGPLRLVLTRRAATLGSHSGQVAFPGGFLEPEDAGVRAAALRESFEEVGLEPDNVSVLGVLDDVYPPRKDVRVTPFVGRLTHEPQWVMNPTEVDRVFTVSLEELAQRERWREEAWSQAGRTVPLYYFDHEGETLWGMSAYIVLGLLALTPWESPFAMFNRRAGGRGV